MAVVVGGPGSYRERGGGQQQGHADGHPGPLERGEGTHDPVTLAGNGCGPN